MSTDKIEKKLPDEILSLIDEEAFLLGISRQEAISRLLTILISSNHEREIKQLQAEMKHMQKIINLKEDEVAYLREELGYHTRGLSKLADSILKTRYDEAETAAVLNSLKESVHTIQSDNSALHCQIESLKKGPYEQQLPIIIIGIIIALLGVFLVLGKMYT